MRFGMMGMAVMLTAATAGMAHGERENGKSWPVPNYSLQEAPVVLAQAATPAAGATPQPDYILKACTETQSMGDPRAAWRSVDPAYILKNYLYASSSGKVVADLTAIKTTLLQGTTHGNIVSGTSTSGRTAYRYDPTANYEGDDRAVFLADFEGKVYKIELVIKVLLVIDQNSSQCDDPPVNGVRPRFP